MAEIKKEARVTTQSLGIGVGGQVIKPQPTVGEELAELMMTGLKAYDTKLKADKKLSDAEDKIIDESEQRAYYDMLTYQERQRQETDIANKELDEQTNFAESQRKEMDGMLGGFSSTASAGRRAKEAESWGGKIGKLETSKISMTQKMDYEQAEVDMSNFDFATKKDLDARLAQNNSVSSRTSVLNTTKGFYRGVATSISKRISMMDPKTFNEAEVRSLFPAFLDKKNKDRVMDNIAVDKIESAISSMQSNIDTAYTEFVDGGIAMAYDDDGKVDIEVLEKLYDDNKKSMVVGNATDKTFLVVQDDLLRRIKAAKGSGGEVPTNTSIIHDLRKNTVGNGTEEYNAGKTVDTSTKAGQKIAKELYETSVLKGNVSAIIQKKDWVELKRITNSNGTFDVGDGKVKYSKEEVQNYLNNTITQLTQKLDTIDVTKNPDAYKKAVVEIDRFSGMVGNKNPFREKTKEPMMDTTVKFKTVKEVREYLVTSEATINELDKDYSEVVVTQQFIKNLVETNKDMPETELVDLVNSEKSLVIQRVRDNRRLTDKLVKDLASDYVNEQAKSIEDNFSYAYNKYIKANPHEVSNVAGMDMEKLEAIMDGSTMRYNQKNLAGLDNFFGGFYDSKYDDIRIPNGTSGDILAKGLDLYLGSEESADGGNVRNLEDVRVKIIDKDTISIYDNKYNGLMRTMSVKDGKILILEDKKAK